MTATVKRTKKASPEKGPLAHLVPEGRFAEEYVSRKIDGVWDVALLRYAKRAVKNTLLFGPTGPGKTSLVLAYAAVENLPLVTVQCNGAVDPSTFWGGWQPDPTDSEGKRLIWVFSEIAEVVKHGGVLYLDEVNFLHPKVAATFHGLLDKRRQITILDKGNEVIHAHENLQVICSYNPDYEGTKPLNPAFKNRFVLKVRFDYDEAVEKELVCMPVMLEIASKLRAAHQNGDLDTPTSTNMLIEFEELALDMSPEFAKSNFLNAYGDEERQAVTETLDMYGDLITAQVAEMEKAAAEAEAEDA